MILNSYHFKQYLKVAISPVMKCFVKYSTRPYDFIVSYAARHIHKGYPLKKVKMAIVLKIVPQIFILLKLHTGFLRALFN